jgi:hypothetical protein
MTPPQPPEHPSILLPSLSAYGNTLLGRFDRAVMRRRAARVGLIIALAAVLIIPAVQAARQIRDVDTSPFRETGERHRTALGRWLPTAGLLAALPPPADPYGYGHWFPTPPMVLISLVPFWKLGYVAAGATWAAIKVLSFLAGMLALIRSLEAGGFRVPAGVLLVAGAFGIRPIVSDLQHANLNIFVVVWVALAWALFLRGRDVWAGLFVALAVVTKVTPALLLLYFLYRREWKVLGGAAAGLLLFFVILPGLYLGMGRNLEYLRSWFDMLVAPFALHGWVTMDIANQSFYGVLLRLLSNAGLISIEHMPAGQAMAAGMEEMARPLTAMGGLFRPALSLALLGAMAWLCRSRCGSRKDLRRWLEYALVLVAMLLLGERTWKHHATTLPVVYLVVWTVLACRPWGRRFTGWFAGGLAVQFILLVAASEGLVGDDLAERLLDGGIFCWGLLLCGVQIGLLIRLVGRTPADAPAAGSAG